MKISTLIISILICTSLYGQNYPMSDPSNTGGWKFNNYISDEFNGSSLDKSKWWILGENDDYRHKWKGRAPGQFAAHNVRVENGDLILTSQWEPNFNFANEKNNGVYYGGTETSPDNSIPITQACVMSEAFFQYGYMEIRCKAANAPVTSSFWTTGYHSEIDMTENFGKRPIGNPENKPESLEKKYRTNMINWDPEKAPDHQNWKVEDELDVRVASDYYVYGFEWDKDYIKTYFNGELVRHATRQELEANDQWRHQYPQELWLDSEVFSWYGLPAQNDLSTPAEYKIDYVRVWQKSITKPQFNAYGFEGPFYFQGRSINWWSGGNVPWRLKDEKPASGDFSLRFKHSGSFSGTYSIFAPYGSSDLPAGDNSITFKIWIDNNTDIDQVSFILNNPRVVIPVNLSGVEKGKWVEITEQFTRNAPSNISLDGGDRMQISLLADDINSSDALLYIDDIEIERSNVTMINNNETIDFSVYPNPADTQLTVKAIEMGTINLYNSAGCLVKTTTKNMPIQTLNISDLPKGVYLLQLTSNSKAGVKKVIVK